ncbi:hypothetical protein [Fluctibacter halophilus]|nr:hypothetical protein [Aestuariibacter halophilus]
MSYTINGARFHKAPPISDVFVNKNTVVFTDHKGQQRVALNNSSQRVKFLHWLVS